MERLRKGVASLTKPWALNIMKMALNKNKI